jgi:hypothetical protein
MLYAAGKKARLPPSIPADVFHVLKIAHVEDSTLGVDLPRLAVRHDHLRPCEVRHEGTEPGVIREILTHLGDPLEPPPVSPARGPPTDWGEVVQIHDNRDVFQPSPDELPPIDIHSL